MKYENIKSLILTILVLISLVLTWNLWTYQPAFDYINSEKLIQDVEISKKEEEENLIRPTKLLIHENGIHYGTTSNQELKRVTNEMQKWSLYDIENYYIEEDFITFMHGKGKREVVFPDEIPLETFRYLLSFSEKDVPNVAIDRIVIDVEKKGHIFLVNYQDRRVYRAKLNNFSSLHHDFYQIDARYQEYFKIPAEETRFIFVPLQPEKMEQIHYITEQIDPENLKDALFNDPSIVTKDQMSTGEMYTDGSRIMTVDSAFSKIDFVNIMNKDYVSPSDYTIIERSIDYVNEHSGWSTGMGSGVSERLSDKYLFDTWGREDDDTTVFRLYVGGYPVFNNSGLSEITQEWRNNEIFRYMRPIFWLKTPLTANEQQTIKLPSAQEMKKELEDIPNFDYSRLEDVRVGYEMKRGNLDGLFILEPVWAYKENGKWSKVYFKTEDNLGGM